MESDARFRPITLGVVEFGDEEHAICMEPTLPHFLWILKKRKDGNWLVHRPALPIEIERAKKRVEELRVQADIPCKGV